MFPPPNPTRAIRYYKYVGNTQLPGGSNDGSNNEIPYMDQREISVHMHLLRQIGMTSIVLSLQRPNSLHRHLIPMDTHRGLNQQNP